MFARNENTFLFTVALAQGVTCTVWEIFEVLPSGKTPYGYAIHVGEEEVDSGRGSFPAHISIDGDRAKSDVRALARHRLAEVREDFAHLLFDECE